MPPAALLLAFAFAFAPSTEHPDGCPRLVWHSAMHAHHLAACDDDDDDDPGPVRRSSTNANLDLASIESQKKNWYGISTVFLTIYIYQVARVDFDLCIRTCSPLAFTACSLPGGPAEPPRGAAGRRHDTKAKGDNGDQRPPTTTSSVRLDSGASGGTTRQWHAHDLHPGSVRQESVLRKGGSHLISNQIIPQGARICIFC